MAIFSNQATLTYNGNTTNSNIAYGEILDVLSATKTAVEGSYAPGELVTYVVTLRNTGNTAGCAVPQLYIRDLIGSRVRPVKELKGFARVDLSPGECKEITLTLPASSLAFHNPAMHKVVEPGKFKLWIAEHALDSSREFDFEVIIIIRVL